MTDNMELITYRGETNEGASMKRDDRTGLSYTWRDWVAKERRLDNWKEEPAQ
jgi:hypothetical protein